MRIGTTSFIYPADIITNVRRLAGRVQDIELVIFECDEQGTDLPDRACIDEMRGLASDNAMTYTVHLPLDLTLADEDNSASLEKARRVIRHTRPLEPHGYVVHMESSNPEVKSDPSRWIENSVASLVELNSEVDDPRLLCVETLEGQAPAQFDRLLESSDASLCFDIGHFWKDRRDPLPLLRKRLDRTRIVHLHGVAEHDHVGLSRMDARRFSPVLEILKNGFDGVVTLEVFSEKDLEDCLGVVGRPGPHA